MTLGILLEPWLLQDILAEPALPEARGPGQPFPARPFRPSTHFSRIRRTISGRLGRSAAARRASSSSSISPFRIRTRTGCVSGFGRSRDSMELPLDIVIS